MFFAWGWNGAGQVVGAYSEAVSSPTRVQITKEEDGGGVMAVSGGLQHSAAISDTGQLYTWGKGIHGRLGHDNEHDYRRPTLVEALAAKRVTRVSCGAYHTAAITSRGEMWTWGRGDHGQLGHGDTSNRLQPTLVEVFRADNQKISLISCGTMHTLAVTGEAPLSV